MNPQAQTSRRGVVYTFYSFKGGAGRTMALANAAALLAKWGYSVLVVDWDLEAPGIERFFVKESARAQSLRASNPGMLDLIEARREGIALDWRDCVLEEPVNGAKISLISAGKGDDRYIARLQGLDFQNLFDNYELGSYIEDLRDQWIAEYEFVLIDSRTGVTDIGGICTVQLADVLILLITTTDSSIEGTLQIVDRARKAQQQIPRDRRRLVAVPVLSRDESRTEYERAGIWKNAIAVRFAEAFADWLPSDITPREAVDLLRIPYVPYWSFGERLPAVEEGTSDPASLGSAYEILGRLLVTRLDWYKALEGRTLAPPPIGARSANSDWLQRHRALAKDGLEKSGKSGYMEVDHFSPNSPINRTQAELLSAAKSAVGHTYGWPIGLVLDGREDARPRPTRDGIVAVIEYEGSFDYWALATNSDFYTLTALREDRRRPPPSLSSDCGAICFDLQIVRVTDALLHCSNLYRALGAGAGARVDLTIRHGGLRGRTLEASSLLRQLSTSKKNVTEDAVASSVSFRLGNLEAEIVGLVKRLCDPLFVVFDFQSFSDEVYGGIVLDFIAGRIT